jgi:hypothetical protein
MTCCERCGRNTNSTIMSRFNTQILCPTCERDERLLPEYPAAVEAEAAACRRGDFNFPGIGYPKRKEQP